MAFTDNMKTITIDNIFDALVKKYDGVVEANNWGERGLFYNPDRILPKGVYILTVKEKDGANDKASNLNRKDIYRLNIGVSKETFKTMYQYIPKRPAAGQIVNTGHAFDQIDTLMPHPVYGWMSWLCVLSPSLNTFEQLTPLIDEAVGLAKMKYEKKVQKKSHQ